MIILKQFKIIHNVYFSYFEAADIGYLSFWTSGDRDPKKWSKCLELPYNLEPQNNIERENVIN